MNNNDSGASSLNNGSVVPPATNDSTVTPNAIGWTAVTTKFQRKSGSNKVKITPIQLERMDAVKLGEITSHLSSTIGVNDLFVQRFGDNKGPRIFCKSEGTKIAVIEHLKCRRIQFNSFNSKDSRRKAFIVRGLCYGNQSEAIEAIEAAVKSLQISRSLMDIRTTQGTIWARYHLRRAEIIHRPLISDGFR